MNKQKEKGFTLVELLIILAVIAILVSVAVFALDPAERMREARDNQRMQEINALANAIKLYKIDNSADQLCERDGENGFLGSGGLIDQRLGQYFDELPADPRYVSGSRAFGYYLDNYAFCGDYTTGRRTDSGERAALIINKFESDKYQEQYNNYGEFCAAGSRYSGESTGSRAIPYAYAVTFTPSCYSE